MTLQDFILWEAGIGIPLLVMFCVWVVMQNFARKADLDAYKLEVAKQSQDYVTWKFVDEFRQWQSTHEQQQRERDAALRAEIGALAVSLAFLRGQSKGHDEG